MILTYGNIAPLADLHWHMLELRSERTIESTLRRLGQGLPNIFRESAIELFIPVAKRDLNTFELSTINCIFVRSNSFQKLLRLKTITGVVGLVTHGDTNHPSKVIVVEDQFVQEHIAKAEASFLNQAQTISIGNFVRIIDGEMRDWCGVVSEISDGSAVVQVDIKTKVLLIETPVRNLLDKSHVPASLRVFYYGELVEELHSQGLEQLVAEDLHYEEDALYTDDGLDTPANTKHGRQQTVTALVKRMIVTGTLDPMIIGKEVLAALKSGSLKKPKNLSIVHGVIKTRLVEDHFIKQDPTIKNYREVVTKFGSQYKFSVSDLARLDPSLDIPLITEEKSSS